jgi:transglutaminase-like putative cysteine protease
MRFQIAHHTRYRYAEAVSLSHNIVRLRPRNHDHQTCLRHELSISPTPGAQKEDLDYFGNYMTYFSFEESHNQLTIDAFSEVEVDSKPPNDLSSGASWELVRQMLLESAERQTLLAREFSFDSPYVTRSSDLASYAHPSFTPGRPLLQCVLDLTERIHNDFEFVPGSTKVGTPVSDVLRTRRGVCQDFTHLQIGCLRSLGLAARYVSGYLATTPLPGRERVVGAAVSHAWVGVYAPECGWVDFDPTNKIMPSDGHISLAWARDYDDLCPIRGVMVGGRRQRLDVTVDVVPAEVP